ncbi:MAG: Gfo/Idh/MocA family oxidoreductase [Abitibacteriaceae bacterium]|nr:Gfo/Idh/MocA family oxidoreductase [Abditibacteriaceae bacterium]
MALKIAVIGTGKVNRDNYIPYLASQSDIELGYYNRTHSTAPQVAEQFGGTVFSSLDEVAQWDPTAALILTSETIRYEIGMQLIGSGIRKVFFEKPLVAVNGQAHVTEDDFYKGKAMLDLARAKGCETAMVFNYRFFEQTLAARQIAAERNFGQVINVAGLVHYACWSHCIDLIQHFAGSIEEITALSGAKSYGASAVGIEAPDVVAALRMKNRATGTLIGTAGMKWQHPLYELIFTFENGRIHMRDLDGTLEILDGATQLHEVRSIARHTARWDQYRDSFTKALSAYLDSLRNEQAPPVPGRAGLEELQVEAALKRSIAEKRPVLVQQEFPI